MQRHQGHISVDSVPEGGALFQIWLPAAPSSQAPVVRSVAHAPRPEIPLYGLRILVLDDDPTILRLSEQALTRLGATVAVTAHAAVRAAHIASTEGLPYDAAMLDLTLPGGPGGHEIVPDLQRLHPGIFAVVSRGYSDKDIFSSPSDFGFNAVLPKPCTLNQILSVLATLHHTSVP